MTALPDRVWTLDEALAARDAARDLAARDALVAEASRVLATAADEREGLAAVTRLAVPLLGDWCAIDLVGDDGRVHRASTASGADDGGFTHVLDAAPAGTWLGPPGTPLPAQTAIAPLPLDEPADRLALPSDRRIRARITAPLVARGVVLGALSCYRAPASPAISADDVRLVEDLAGRVASAIDNWRLLRRLEAASAAKSQFLAGMSHEFRTPLQAILGFSDLIRAEIPEPVPPHARRHAERIHRAAEHMLALVEQVLTFSKLERRREEVRVERFDVAALARDLVLLVEPLAREKGLRLTVDAPAEGAIVETDLAKVRQILYNLLANAVRYTDAGEVSMAAVLAGDRLRIAVRDTGIGIAPEHRERIFEDFWQAERSVASGRGGTGLGLGIARRLAHLLGGELHVASELGRGSTFTLDLPVRHAAPGADAAPETRIA